ncbi:MAG: zinc-binding dehydrogenase [Chloroflexi bacterium]|nr:zinc-binding dehydrogenase [Chloroflexota bacterium]
MKTVIINAPRELLIKDVDIPKPGPDDVLVRVRASGICGSDVHRYLGTAFGRTWKYPMNSGHEYCGEVVEIGKNVKRFREGDHATLGVAWPQGYLGAFSEYVLIPNADERLYQVPKEVSFIEGACLEPFTVALQACRRPNPTSEDKVLILGAGAIGLSVLWACKARGVQNIIVSEISDKRRGVAEQIGCRAVNPAAEDLAEIVMDATGGQGADVAFECAGTGATLNQAFALTNRWGRISLIAHYRQEPPFSVETIARGGKSVYGPFSPGPTVEEAIQLVAEKKVDLTSMVSHTFPLEKAQQAFEVACDAAQSVKVLFVP